MSGPIIHDYIQKTIGDVCAAEHFPTLARKFNYKIDQWSEFFSTLTLYFEEYPAFSFNFLTDEHDAQKHIFLKKLENGVRNTLSIYKNRTTDK